MESKLKKVTNSETIRIRPDSIDEKELYDYIVELNDIKKRTNKLKKEENTLKSKLKKLSLFEYLEEYKMNNENPGSIIIEAYDKNKKGEFLYVIADKYIKIDKEEDANKLIEKYGKDVIKKDRKYIFNPEMLEKYSETLSKMIMESEDIEETDKGNLFIAEEKYIVIHGTIDKLMNISEDSFEDVEQVFEDLRPIESIKNSKIIKS